MRKKRPRKESDEETDTEEESGEESEEEWEEDDTDEDVTQPLIDPVALRGERDYDDILFGAPWSAQQEWEESGEGDTCKYGWKNIGEEEACFDHQRPPRSRAGFDDPITILPDSENLWKSENAVDMTLKHWNKRKSEEEELEFVSLCYANMYRDIADGSMEYFVTFRAKCVDSGVVGAYQAYVSHHPRERKWQWQIRHFRKKED